MATKDKMNKALDDWDGGDALTQEDRFVVYLAEGYSADDPEVPEADREAYRKYLED